MFDQKQINGVIVNSVVAGAGAAVDATDPKNPIIKSAPLIVRVVADTVERDATSTAFDYALMLSDDKYYARDGAGWVETTDPMAIVYSGTIAAATVASHMPARAVQYLEESA